MALDQRAYIEDVFLADLPAPIPELGHRPQYEPLFLGTQGLKPVFFAAFTSARPLAATSAQPAPWRGRLPPSTAAPHMLPAAWSVRPLPATTRTAPSKAVSVPASIPGRHS